MEKRQSIDEKDENEINLQKDFLSFGKRLRKLHYKAESHIKEA